MDYKLIDGRVINNIGLIDDADEFSRFWGITFEEANLIKEKIESFSLMKKTKITGIEFNGVMCSATGDDQAGLSALLLKHTVLKLSGQKMPDVHFRFENGNILTINSDNIEELDAIWTPFRMSFFPPQQ